MRAEGNSDWAVGARAGGRKRDKEERGKDRGNRRVCASTLAGVQVFVLSARVCSTNLGGVDSSLLEGTAGGVMGTQVAVLAPVAAEGTVHT